MKQKIILLVNIVLIKFAVGYNADSITYSFNSSYWLINPYQIRERYDYNTNRVYYELWQDSIFIGIDKVLSFADYFLMSTTDGIKNRRTAGTSTPTATDVVFDRMGLIPDVELPRIPLIGEGSRINISGSDKITFGGRQTFTSGFTQTATSPRLLPELKMDQVLRVNLEGTIGERTKVIIDHDSEREQLGKNKIKLTYTGTEDDILQSLEFGDTRLVIPGTAYTGDLPARSGLFGITSKAKLGAVDLYAIASREESQGETKEFRGQTRIVSDTIYDSEFLRRTFFWIGETITGRITDLKVYINDGNINNPNAEIAISTVKWWNPTESTAYRYDRDSGRYVLKVRGEDYIFHEESNIIEFVKSAPIPSNWGIGISYVINNDTVGKRMFLYSDTMPILVLKMIKPRYPDTLSMCWNYELKNIYSLGAKDVRIQDIKILRYKANVEPMYYPEIEDAGPKSGQTFLQILGLDPDNNGKIEWPEFDASKGYIVFPYQFPFAHPDLSEIDPIIYRKDNLLPNEGRKYLIVVNYSTAKGSISLGQFDIEEGSEKVYVNGQLLSKEDYEINYLTGEVKFIKPLPQNAEIKVTYEYRPLFSIAQKSLIGTRGEWKFADNGKIGTSFFFRQEATPEVKTTLGSEPFRRFITETDLSYNYKPQFIDDILQKVPLLKLSSPSSFSFNTEGAISLPNSNTRGIAYIDDFEKTTLSQEVSLRGLLWQFSSVPEIKDTSTFANERIFWYNPTNRIRKDSIFGANIGEEGKETVDYLRIIYTPTDTLSWAGIMSSISQSGWNLKDIENLEVIFRSHQRNIPKGKIYFTIATRIDEDAPRRTKTGIIAGYNNSHDKEDQNNNGILDEALGEDIGLDGIQGVDNQAVFGDDGNDDYHATLNPIGTEGNRRLDDEDIDQNGFSRHNEYFEFSVDLNDSLFISSLANDWKIIRIPIMDTILRKRANFYQTSFPAKWEDIRIVRIWLSNFLDADTLDFYSLAFVGSRWRNAQVIKADTTIYPNVPVDSTEKVQILSISQKTDPNYIPPYELRRDQTGRTEYEAALSFVYDSIKTGHMGIVTKYSSVNEDFRDYQKIKIYVHNDINDPTFIFRFGSDSLNFYEYQAKVSEGTLVPGRDDKWYEFDINLDTAVFIKSIRSSAKKDTTVGHYRVYGSPTIANIRYQALGILNTSSTRISGNIWFNDIRLTNPRTDVGYGFQSSMTFNLSDFASVGFSYIYSDPNFRRFSEGRGVKTGGYGTTYTYNIRTALDKFFPTSWGLSIPISFRRSNNRTLPKYSSKFSDLRLSLTDSLLEQEKIVNNDEQLSINLSKRKSNNRIFNYTIEALSLSFGERKLNSKSFLNSDSVRTQYGSLDYSINPELKISLFDKDIYLLPNSISAGLDITNSRSKPYTRRSVQDTWQLIRRDSSRIADVGLNVDYSPIEDLNISYSYNSSQDLLVPPTNTGITKISGLNLGISADNEESFGAEYELELFDILKPRINYDGQYSEIHPKIQGVYTEKRNFNNSSNIDLATEFDLPGVFDKIGDLSESSNKIMSKLSSVFQSIDVSYSKEFAYNATNADKRPPFLFRIGFSPYDTSLFRAQQITRRVSDDFSASSGARFKDLTANLRYGYSIDKNIYTYDINGNSQIIWPEISLSLSRVEKLLFGLATNSSFSTSYQLQQSKSGTILADSFRIEGRRQTLAKNFSPLLSWQTTWKSRVTTNISANYSQSSDDIFLANGISNSKTVQNGANASLSYTFSTPKGIPIFFLKKVRLPSDLNLTWSFRYNKALAMTRDYLGNESKTREDKNIGTDIATSFRLSNSVESGFTTGYSAYTDIQRGRSTKNIDVNFWVLFKF